MTVTGDRLYDSVAALHATDGSADTALHALLEAGARTVEKPNDALRYDDTGSGARRMHDPDRCPEWALPWLSQYAGIREIPAGLSTAETRALIRDAPGQRRGTPGAIIAAIKPTLTGTKTVFRLPRYEGDPDVVAYITHADETPDPDGTLAAILTQKPWGLLLVYSVVTGWSIGELEAAYTGLTITDLEADFATITDLEAGP